MSPEDVSVLASITFYLAIIAASLYLLASSLLRRPARHRADVQQVLVEALDDYERADPTTPLLGSAGVEEGLHLVTEPASPRGVTPADGLPVVRLAHCTRCRDLGFLGGCRGCGRVPVMTRRVPLQRVNGARR